MVTTGEANNWRLSGRVLPRATPTPSVGDSGLTQLLAPHSPQFSGAGVPPARVTRYKYRQGGPLP